VGRPGKNREYYEKFYPGLGLPDLLGKKGWWNRPYEERPQRRERAQRFLNELLQRHGKSDNRVMVFSHGGFYNHFLTALLNLPISQTQSTEETIQADNDQHILTDTTNSIWFSMMNCAITRIDFDVEEVRLVYQNRVDFLPAELIT
jgi:2,3-bisphosphoglycerate-dependent phosphoglycerate mutase